MKKRFTLFGLLVAVAFLAMGFSLLDTRRRLAAAHRENSLFRVNELKQRHEELRLILANDDRHNRVDQLVELTNRIAADKGAQAIPYIETEIAELEQELQQFDRISPEAYDVAIEKTKALEFDRNPKVTLRDAKAIVDFIVSHPHIDPRVLHMEPYSYGAVRVYTGEIDDNWGFIYVARKDRSKWIVRYSKGWPSR